MGLDISIRTDKDDEILDENYFIEENNFFNLHSLSRTFCNLICRKHMVEIPELNQIGKITNIDIEVIYQMEEYPNEDELEYELEIAENESERIEILKTAEYNKSKLNGNLKIVLETISKLIISLGKIEKIQELLNDNEEDTLDNKTYFSDFNQNKGQGYIDNNFGQDLRNFERFLIFAKGKGANTTWFEYN